MKFKIKNIRLNRNNNSNTKALFTVSLPGVPYVRFRIAQDKKHHNPIVYPLRHMEGGSKKLKDNIKLEPVLMAKIQTEVLKKFAEKINRVKNKKVERLILVAFPLRMLFHFYTKKKSDIVAFRIWMVSRYLFSDNHSGWALVSEVATIVMLKPEYIHRICQNSKLFRGVTPKKIYYVSTQKVMKINRLNTSHYGLYRYEKLNAKLLSYFKSNRTFAGYICKCYAEKDLQKKIRQTHGRVSLQKMAEVFQVCSKTIWSLLHLVNAKIIMNIKEYPDKIIRGEYSAWLLHNIDTKLENGSNRTIEDNPCSFFFKKKNNERVLAQRLPNIYKFTGYSQVLRKPTRGNGLRPRNKQKADQAPGNSL